MHYENLDEHLSMKAAALVLQEVRSVWGVLLGFGFHCSSVLSRMLCMFPPVSKGPPFPSQSGPGDTYGTIYSTASGTEKPQCPNEGE